MAARTGVLAALFLVVFHGVGVHAVLLAGDATSAKDQLALGRELFFREWVANDPRSHGGDGLGPVFNERSCVACHSQGGAGGGGPVQKNVQLLSAFALSKAASGGELDFDKLATLHQGLRNSQSVVVHLSGTRASYDKWRAGRFSGGKLAGFQVIQSERNSTALFGAGLIDQIPESAMLDRTTVQHAGFPEVRGRVSRLANGRIGRFGWKADKASLHDFAMTACAVELGLNVPEQPQSMIPDDPKYKAPGLDMDRRECEALVAFLKQIPEPVQTRSAPGPKSISVHAGEKLFTSVGCATCHAPKLSWVSGIYSDLLLHDMGPDLSSPGSYGGESAEDSVVDAGNERRSFAKQSEGEAAQQEKARERSQQAGATRSEWRTPPLWGVHNSAPYMHDGRAATLEQAIQQHGGEARESFQRYAKLSKAKQKQLIAFLDSLVAPAEVAKAPQ